MSTFTNMSANFRPLSNMSASINHLSVCKSNMRTFTNMSSNFRHLSIIFNMRKFICVLLLR